MRGAGNGRWGATLAAWGFLLGVSLPARAQADAPRASAPASAPAPAPAEGAASVAASESSADHPLRYLLESVRIEGNTRTQSRVVRALVPFRAGEVLDVTDPKLTLTQYRLLGTGFFRRVWLGLRKGSAPGRAVLVVEVEERNTLVLTDLAMGLSAAIDPAGQGRPLAAFAGVAAAENNLLGLGSRLSVAFARSQGATLDSDANQSALRLRWDDPALGSNAWALSLEVLHNRAVDAVASEEPTMADPVIGYRRSGVGIAVGRSLALPTRLWVGYRLETITRAELLTPPDSVGTPAALPLDLGRSLLSTARVGLQSDTRDHPLLTTRGTLATLSLESSLTPLGSDYAYGRLDARFRRMWPLGPQDGVGLDLFAGAIIGRAPLYELYHVSDFSEFQAGRLLGLNFDRRPAPNFLGTAIEESRVGNYAGKLSFEYRRSLYQGHHSLFGVEAFARLGAFLLAAREPPPAARRYDGLSRIPVDLTATVGVRMDTSLGGLTFSFANLLGLLPLRPGGDP